MWFSGRKRGRSVVCLRWAQGKGWWRRESVMLVGGWDGVDFGSSKTVERGESPRMESVDMAVVGSMSGRMDGRAG